MQIWEERQKLYTLGEHATTLLLFVTDDKVPVDECDEPDLLCIGQEQHMAIYGPIGCLKAPSHC